MKIRRLDRRDQGYTRIEWVLDYYEGPKRIRKFFYAKGDAEAAADEVKQQHRHTGQSWLELTSMFDVAWKKGYIKENPCLRLPTVKLRQEAPVIFTPD